MAPVHYSHDTSIVQHQTSVSNTGEVARDPTGEHVSTHEREARHKAHIVEAVLLKGVEQHRHVIIGDIAERDERNINMGNEYEQIDSTVVRLVEIVDVDSFPRFHESFSAARSAVSIVGASRTFGAATMQNLHRTSISHVESVVVHLVERRRCVLRSQKALKIAILPRAVPNGDLCNNSKVAAII